jgi:Tfp pilus assembly protein PilO
MEDALIVGMFFALVAAGEVVYLVVIWLKYQKEAASLEIRQAQLLQQSDMNARSCEQARDQLAQVAERTAAVEKDIPGLKERLVLLRGSRNKKEEEKDYHSATRHKVD